MLDKSGYNCPAVTSGAGLRKVFAIAGGDFHVSYSSQPMPDAMFSVSGSGLGIRDSEIWIPDWDLGIQGLGFKLWGSKFEGCLVQGPSASSFHVRRKGRAKIIASELPGPKQGHPAVIVEVCSKRSKVTVSVAKISRLLGGQN